MDKRKGFTLIELLVVISIIALLLSILMPSLQRVKEQARSIICRTNLHGYGLAMGMYTADNNSKIPEGCQWLMAGVFNSNGDMVASRQSGCSWHRDITPDGHLASYLDEMKGGHLHKTQTILKI